MSMALWIGNVTLNVSFVLYLIVYLPQIIHNRVASHIAQLSLWWHVILYLTYWFDLLYGFSSHLPWQYKTVSIIGFSLMVIQHTQLLFFFAHQRKIIYVKWGMAFLMVGFLAMYSFFTYFYPVVDAQVTLSLGVMARVLGLVYGIPQIIKNKRTQSAQAISIPFICINLSLTLLDSVSAWCLDWGWPNKVASPISFVMMTTILLQHNKYKQRPVFHSSASSLEAIELESIVK